MSKTVRICGNISQMLFDRIVKEKSRKRYDVHLRAKRKSHDVSTQFVRISDGTKVAFEPSCKKLSNFNQTS